MLAISGLGGPDQVGIRHDGAPLLLSYAARLAGAAVPRICVLNTAAADDPAWNLRAYQMLAPLGGRVSHLELFPMPNVADPADLLLSQDLIFVGGGSVANMLAVWRVHGLDQVMRAAWERGVVLSGVSAGAICWFGAGTTDSFGPDLRPFTDGLEMLAGSYCPHYDSEPSRRPLFQRLVGDGTLPAGIACHDGAAAHFADSALATVVTDRPSARGYLVARGDGGTAVETELAVTQLGN